MRRRLKSGTLNSALRTPCASKRSELNLTPETVRRASRRWESSRPTQVSVDDWRAPPGSARIGLYTWATSPTSRRNLCTHVGCGASQNGLGPRVRLRNHINIPGSLLEVRELGPQLADFTTDTVTRIRALTQLGTPPPRSLREAGGSGACERPAPGGTGVSTRQRTPSIRRQGRPTSWRPAVREPLTQKWRASPAAPAGQPIATAARSSQSIDPSTRLIRLGAVCTKVGLGRSTIWRLIKDGKFPQPGGSRHMPSPGWKRMLTSGCTGAP